jgi:ABC-2 type transport system permease protein
MSAHPAAHPATTTAAPSIETGTGGGAAITPRKPGLGGLMRAEAAKLNSTRAPRWVAASAIGMTLLALSGAVASGGIPEESLRTADGLRTVLGHGGLAAILALVLGVLATASEHRHGTIVDTYLSEPRRGRMLSAKVATLAVAGVTVGLVVAAAAWLGTTAWYAGKGIELPLGLGDATTLGTLAGIVAWNGLYAVLGVALGTIIRTPAGAIVTAVLWLFVLETAIAGLIPDFGKWLPAMSALALGNTPGEGLLSQGAGGLTLLGWTALAVAGAYVAVTRRDVT